MLPCCAHVRVSALAHARVRSINEDGAIDFQEFELAIQRNQLQVNTRVAFM